MALAQLVFDPAYDPYHTIFRMQRLIISAEKDQIEVDRLRIADFYDCFPILVDQFRQRPGDRRFRTISRGAHLPYGGRPDGRLVFTRMQPTQAAAMRTLASAGYLELAALHGGIAKIVTREFPEPILLRINQMNSEQPILADFLKTILNDFPLDGPDGLKHRSALLDHRYDAV